MYNPQSLVANAPMYVSMYTPKSPSSDLLPDPHTDPDECLDGTFAILQDVAVEPDGIWREQSDYGTTSESEVALSNAAPRQDVSTPCNATQDWEEWIRGSPISSPRLTS